jgi:hypothetical protein
MISGVTVSPNRIISASRRTDLPGYHPRECTERLTRLRKPVHSVFFWTRYPGSFVRPGALSDLLRGRIENPIVHLTVTGLGGSDLEPRVPGTAEVLGQLDGLTRALGGEPERILWRFDPVLREAMSLASFTTLGEEFSRQGVKTCIFSFPSAMSLKGPLDEQYRRSGLSRWSRAEKGVFALRMAEVAARLGLQLYACNQPQVVEDTQGAVLPASCISAELAVRLHPRHLPLDLPKDPAQRRHCNCVTSDDIGRYSDRCLSGCAYCYSSAGGPVERA